MTVVRYDSIALSGYRTDHIKNSHPSAREGTLCHVSNNVYNKYHYYFNNIIISVKKEVSVSKYHNRVYNCSLKQVTAALYST